ERDERGTGQALAGRLLRGCLDRGIEPRTGMRATRLLTEDGRVVGVRFETAEGPVDVGAARGVVIATGGFEWDPELVGSFLRGPLDRPASVPTNTGDGLRMAMRVGAALGNMREAWWAPTIDVPTPTGTASWLVNGERTRPRSIIVNSRGARFANEAVNYNAFGAAFHVVDVTTFEYVNNPAWMVFDHGYWTSYGLAGHRGDSPVPSWITRADSIEELADQLGVQPDALAATIKRFNENAADECDPDFGRGGSAVDKWWGDPSRGTGPAATLGPLDTAPYYAVRVYSGALGTKGGPRTDAEGRVLDVDLEPIAGLYAAGNAMAVTAMGMTYGGAGGTLGPALVSGYVAGDAAAAAVQR
ncbi:MAG: putative 3-ketosteroid delta(1)-dehydrogenase, partial [Modestobacter sp.]|nr:putative 3-ketosteroid delta(1)-dehydrogenase [Modestobacter sp.]